jgi:hypothetical protein
MTHDIRHTLESIIAYCEKGSQQAHAAEVSRTTVLPVGTTTGMTMAFNRVAEYARTLLTDSESTAA